MRDSNAEAVSVPRKVENNSARRRKSRKRAVRDDVAARAESLKFNRNERKAEFSSKNPNGSATGGNERGSGETRRRTGVPAHERA